MKNQNYVWGRFVSRQSITETPILSQIHNPFESVAVGNQPHIPMPLVIETTKTGSEDVNWKGGG